MDSTFNPVSGSGIGFKLEHFVQASFLVTLLLETPVPFGSEGEVEELQFQAKQIANTDDLLVHLAGKGKKSKIYVQSKKGLELNRNKIFDELIDALWKDFNKDDFDRDHDRFIVTTEILSKTDTDDGLLVLEWARGSKNWQDFNSKIKKNKKKLEKLKYFVEAIKVSNGGSADLDAVTSFLSAIYIKTYDYLTAGSKDRAVLKWFIKPFLKAGKDPETVLLDLIDYIQTCNQYGRTITKQNIDAHIKEHFDLAQSPQIGFELKELIKKSATLVKHSIQNDVAGVHIDRSALFLEISKQEAEKSFIIITGDGGVGKSALAKDYLMQAHNADGGWLAFKADLFDRSSLGQSLAAVGVHLDFSTIVSQWLIFPRLVIYIDSFEKLYESSHKEAFLEFLGILKETNDVKIIATCRDFAVETLRQKYGILSQDLGLIPLSPLTDGDLDHIASNRPSLKAVINNPRLRKLISLPFYLNLAARIVDSLQDKDNIAEKDFRNALWEQIIEKRGSGSVGKGKKRAGVFSSIVKRRASEKLPYIKPDVFEDPETIGELESDGLLLKHPSLDLYAPAHDIFEDMVVVRHLHEMFQNKVNALSFLAAIDNNPVFKRALRIWIQELIVLQPGETGLFLMTILPFHRNSDTMVDEILVGILGANDPYLLFHPIEAIVLADNISLFFKVLRLLKVAYVQPYEDENPERKIKCTGHGWTALLRIMDANYDTYKKWFDVVLVDLLYHWTLQFEADEALPEEGTIVAKHCFALLSQNAGKRNFFYQGKVLQILFRVTPLVPREVEAILTEAIENKLSNSKAGTYPVSFYRDLFKMVLVDTAKCASLYKVFPELIVRLAKMEWYVPMDLVRREGDSPEAACGLTSYPYKYFSASAFQTPFRYLFRYHPEIALGFLLELCNRAVEFYRKSEYFQSDSHKYVQFLPAGGTAVDQLGDGNLWGSYRGMGHTPDLIKSALMAFEVHLLDGIDGLASELFDEVLMKSNSVLTTAVLASVAMAYPLAFKERICTLFKSRWVFLWDFWRFSSEMTGMHGTEIGNEFYFTHERYLSNRLKHRRTNLEYLVKTLQLYIPQLINPIIDEHILAADPQALDWKLALRRMDIRKTIPTIDEEKEQIIFTPEPLPVELQEYVEDGREDSDQYLDYMSMGTWASKTFKNEHEEPVSFEEWKIRYEKIKSPAFQQNQPFGKIEASVSAIGLRDFLNEMSEDELQMATADITATLQTTSDQLKAGYFQSALDVFYKADFSILPILLRRELGGFISRESVKKIILDYLILLPHDEKNELIQGINTWLWDIDKAFADQCLQVLFKRAKFVQVSQAVYQLRNKWENETLLVEVDKILQTLYDLPPLTTNEISLLTCDPNWIMYGLKLIPNRLLSTEHKEFFQKMVLELGQMEDLSEFNNYDFATAYKDLLANFLLSVADEGAVDIMLSLLSIARTHFKFVVETLTRFILFGHDNKYPSNLWTHLDTLFTYLAIDPKVEYIKILLFEPISRPFNAYKLPEDPAIKVKYRTYITAFITLESLFETIFKLLAGIGTAYQPECLSWVMKSLPGREAYDKMVILDTTYFEAFVRQLYDNHIDHIRTNREYLEYFIILLNILVDRGSTMAFRIRDEVV